MYRAVALAVMVLAQTLAAATHAETVGQADHVLSVVYGTPPGAPRGAKVLNDPVAFKELIETTPDAAMEARFVDGSRMTVGASAKVLVDEFVFDPKSTKSNALITITLGTLRFVSGTMPKGTIHFDTPTATVGIRGTRLKIRVSATGSTLIAVEEGQVEVTAKASGQSAVVGAGQSLEVPAGGGGPLKPLVKPGVQSVGNAYVDLGWDAAAKGGAASASAAGTGGTSDNLPSGNVAEIKPATRELMDRITAGFGTMPGGIMITGAGSSALPEVQKVAYDFKANLFKVNGKITYKPPLPAALVRLVLQRLASKGMPGTSITNDRAIIFGGFDPYDAIGTMLFGNDWTAGNMLKFPEFMEGYKLPSALKTAFPKSIDRDTLVIMFDYRQRGFRIEGDKIMSRGVAVAPYWLPTSYVGGERKAEPERLAQINSDSALQARLKAFVGDFTQLKQDVSIDFVLRLTDVVGFVDAIGGSAKIDTTGMPPATISKTDSTARDSATVARRDAPKKEIRENFWGTLNELDNPPNWTKLPDDGADMDVEGSEEEIKALLHFRDS
jgi:hypothetical protein